MYVKMFIESLLSELVQTFDSQLTADL